MYNTFTILTFIILLAGPIVLQLFLSRKENKWFSLILPIISVIISLIPILFVPVSGDATIAQNIIQVIIVEIIRNFNTLEKVYIV